TVTVALSVTGDQSEGNISIIIKDRDPHHHAQRRLAYDMSHDSNLRKTALHKKFRPCDIATLIRCEKHNSISDLIRPAKPAKRDRASDHLAPLLTRFARCKQILQAGRVDGTRADRVATTG